MERVAVDPIIFHLAIFLPVIHGAVVHEGPKG